MYNSTMANLFFSLILVISALLHVVSGDIFWRNVQQYDGQSLLHGKAKLSSGEHSLNYFNRLPASSKNTTRPSIYGLQQMPAGMFVQFSTNSSSIHTTYNLGHSTLGMWHFPPTGVSGMDAYAWSEANATWRWIATTHPLFPTTQSILAALRCVSPSCPTKTYRIHLPTYNTILNNFSVGLSSSFDTFVPSSSHFQDPKIASVCWYGSSILQGAVASRPGQIMTHVVSRSLKTLIYNFGFSGNCLMETSVAQYFVQVEPPPSMFIIDCNPNMDYLLIQERAIPLIQFIRSHGHKTTPIIMTEGTKHGTDWYSETSRVGRYNKTVVLKAAFDTLVKNGDAHLYYSTSNDIYSDSLGMNPAVSGDGRFLVDPTVGGTHPTDLGMRKQAKYWEKKIPSVLAQDQKQRRSLSKEAANNTGILVTKVHATLRDQHFEDLYDLIDQKQQTKENSYSFTLNQYNWTDGEKFLAGFSTFTDSHGKVLPRKSPYNRLPAEARSDVRDTVWTLSEMSTGMYLRFTTNAADIAINHTLAYPSQSLWHMPFTGTDGIDVYAWSVSDSSWRHVPTFTGIELFAGNGKNMSGVFHQPEPADGSNNEYWTYLIYLPLRNSPKKLEIGISSEYNICGKNISLCKNDVNVAPPPKFDQYKPIVWYGTSIQQGGVASRGGNEYDAIISRALSVDIHNFGFAGNGIMETSVAKYLSMVEASIIVIDCLPNMGAASVLEKTIPLVHFLRNSTNHQTTPIVLAEGTPYPAEWLDGAPFADAPKNAALKKSFDALVSAGVESLYYVEGKDLFKNTMVNPTVGGVHSSDLGQYEIADYYVQFLPTVLKSNEFSVK